MARLGAASDHHHAIRCLAQVKAARREIEQQQERLVKAWEQVEGARVAAGLSPSAAKQVRTDCGNVLRKSMLCRTIHKWLV